MSLMTDATAFVDKLLRQPVDPRRCPHCGSTRAFDLAAKAGLNLEHITVFVSDGAAGFRAFLARCLNDGQQAPPMGVSWTSNTTPNSVTQDRTES